MNIPTSAIRWLPVSDLTISDINPRQDVDDASVAALAESIAACGLLHPLSVLIHGDGPAEVVAGGRRLRALRLLADQGRWTAQVPVLATADDTTARDWAMAENTARQDLTPADEVLAYRRMARAGQDPRTIALAFGVTERHVRGRLRLADLPDAALAALAGRKITLDQAEALTMCRDPDVAADFLERAKKGVATWRLRSDIVAAAMTAKDSKVRLVGLDVYRAAGGALVEDLFSDTVVIEDEELLHRLFAARVDAHRDELLAQGWGWVEYRDGLLYDVGRGMAKVWPMLLPLNDADAARAAALEDLDQLDDDQAAELDRLTQRGFALIAKSVLGGWFALNEQGEFFNHLDRMAFVRPQDERAAADLGLIAPPRAPDAAGDDAADTDPGDGWPAAVLADLRAIQLHTVQSAMLEKLDFAAFVDLLTFVLDGRAGQWQRVLDLRVGDTANLPAVSDGFRPDDRLSPPGPTGGDVAADFAAFRATDGFARDEALFSAIARLVLPRSDLWQWLIDATGARLRDRWTPTLAFFDRLRAAHLDKIHADLFGPESGPDAPRAFAKMKKSEKARFLDLLFAATPAQRALTSGWSAAAESRLSTWSPEI